MNNRDLINIAIKIFGFYFAAQAIAIVRELILYGMMVTEAPDGNLDSYVLLMPLFEMAFNIGAAWALVFKSDWLVEKMKFNDSGVLQINLDKAGWIELAIIVVSVIALMRAVPEILNSFTKYTFFNEYDRDDRSLYWTGTKVTDIVYAIFKFVTALFFMLNARNYSRRLLKVGDRDDKLME